MWKMIVVIYVGPVISSISAKDELLKSTNQVFSYSEIVRITNNFTTIIGKGGFGKVYLGTLECEKRVAVKILSSPSAQGYKEFQSEVIRCINQLCCFLFLRQCIFHSVIIPTYFISKLGNAGKTIDACSSQKRGFSCGIL